MFLHRLASVVTGLPNVQATRPYYSHFSQTADESDLLPPTAGGSF